MLFDAIGMLGVLMILTTYTLVQLDRISVRKLSYSLINALGAGLILVSLYVDFNLSAVVIESSWLLISLFGIYTSFRKKSGGLKPPQS
jgi:hypothetical protein